MFLKGTKVVYNKKEKGVIKSVDLSDPFYVFVVYHCNNDWENYENYTAARTKITDLDFGGWITFQDLDKWEQENGECVIVDGPFDFNWGQAEKFLQANIDLAIIPEAKDYNYFEDYSAYGLKEEQRDHLFDIFAQFLNKNGNSLEELK